MVCFKFKEGTTDAAARALVEGFARLRPLRTRTALSFCTVVYCARARILHMREHGSEGGKMTARLGFTHCFTLTFDCEADRDAYLPHPAHVAYGRSHAKAADVLVLDTLLA